MSQSIGRLSTNPSDISLHYWVLHSRSIWDVVLHTLQSYPPCSNHICSTVPYHTIECQWNEIKVAQQNVMVWYSRVRENQIVFPHLGKWDELTVKRSIFQAQKFVGVWMLRNPIIKNDGKPSRIVRTCLRQTNSSTVLIVKQLPMFLRKILLQSI